AFGVDAIIVGETSSSPYLRRAVRNSMGTVFHIPVVHTENLVESLKWLSKNSSTRIVGTVPGGDTPIQDLQPGKNVCLVLGSEEAGLSKGILEVCDARVAIPMADGVDSLNVASASAVFLYEATSARSKDRGYRQGPSTKTDSRPLKGA